MTKIILDTNVIIAYPKLLALSGKEFEIIIPFDVLSELHKRADRDMVDRLTDLIEHGVKQGSISIVNADSPKFYHYKQVEGVSGLSETDLAILAVAQVEMQQNAIPVQVATFDKLLAYVVSKYAIPVLSAQDIRDLIKTHQTTFSKFKIESLLAALLENIALSVPLIGSFLVEWIKPKQMAQSIQDKVSSIEIKANAKFIWGIFAGIAISVVGYLLIQNIQGIMQTVNIWGTIIMTILLGVLLFVIREKQRLSYGIAEFIVGVLSIIYIFRNVAFDYYRIQPNLDFTLKILAGLYIMVRGQDNIVKAIKNTSIGIRLKNAGIGA